MVNVGQTLDLNLTLKLAAVSETISVRAETPLIQTSSSSVGGVVDVSRLENLPLNGRQFANAALSIPGVGLGFHSDPTKSTQYSPQIGGGNGRNVNYQIDGGDNNDDTVGGLLQLFPLEAIQEFNFVTQRYKAEYGRSNGGVMNIVTKSGTNDFHGSWFTSMRNTDMNSKTFKTEKLNNVAQGRVRAVSVRRLVRRPDHAEQGALLRRLRAHAAGHDAVGQHARPLPGPGRRLPDADAREPVHGEGLGEPHADAVPVGPLWPQHQLAGLWRDDTRACRTAGATARTRSTRSTSTTTGCWADRS